MSPGILEINLELFHEAEVEVFKEMVGMGEMAEVDSKKEMVEDFKEIVEDFKEMVEDFREMVEDSREMVEDFKAVALFRDKMEEAGLVISRETGEVQIQNRSH